jgi:hypothetical protein
MDCEWHICRSTVANLEPICLRIQRFQLVLCTPLVQLVRLRCTSESIVTKLTIEVILCSPQKQGSRCVGRDTETAWATKELQLASQCVSLPPNGDILLGMGRPADFPI